MFTEHLYAELFKFLALTGLGYYFELQIQRISNYPHLKTSKVVSSQVGISRCFEFLGCLITQSIFHYIFTKREKCFTHEKIISCCVHFRIKWTFSEKFYNLISEYRNNMYNILPMHSSSLIKSYALLMIKNIISPENYKLYHVRYHFLSTKLVNITV